MIYRKSLEGNYEAVRENGEIILFDSKEEMIAFIKKREELNYLLDKTEKTDFDETLAILEDVECSVALTPEKIKKIRIHKGKYVVDGAKIKKALA